MQKVRGLVLKKIRFKDSDLIIKVLLSDGSKVTLFAKSALKSKKRFGGSILDPLSYLDLQLSPKVSDSEFMILNEAQILYDFPKLKTDYDRLKLGLYFLKILNKFESSSLDSASLIFDLLLHALRSLESAKNINILKSQFEYKFLSLQGVLDPNPELDPFIKTSLYESDTLLGINEVLLKRSAFEIENFIEQILEV